MDERLNNTHPLEVALIVEAVGQEPLFQGRMIGFGPEIEPHPTGIPYGAWCHFCFWVYDDGKWCYDIADQLAESLIAQGIIEKEREWGLTFPQLMNRIPFLRSLL